MTRARFAKLIGTTIVLLCVVPFLRRANSDNASTEKLSDQQTIIHQGQSRSYRTYVSPQSPEKPNAVVLLLHGHGGSADQLMGVTGRQAPYRVWQEVADREHLILVVPNGLVGSDGKQGWNDARALSSNPKSDDVAFLNKLVETVAKLNPVDLKRVYATGTSNGGHMALRLAAESPGKYAAVAAVAAANPKAGFAQRPPHPISIMLMNGTDDRILPFDGGKMIRNRGEVQSTDESIQYWIRHNECETKPQTTQYADRSKSDECTASLDTYSNAMKNVEVAVVRIQGGGHAEPSIKQPYSRLFQTIVGAQNQDFEMAEEIWRFFRGKSKAVSPSE